MSKFLPNVLTRRRFAGLSMGVCLAGLAGCGGGGLDPVGDAAWALKEAPAVAGPGMIAQPSRVLAGPGISALELKSVSELADGGFAVAWVQGDAANAGAPRHLLVQQFDRLGEPVAPPVSLPVDITGESAAIVLRDGTTVLVWLRTVYLRTPPDVPVVEYSIQHRRFDPAGQPLDEGDVAARLQYDFRSRDSLELRNPKVDRWPDGSHVVAWSVVRNSPRVSPSLSVGLQARRYHTNGWPDGGVVSVGGSANTSEFTLKTWERQGGYVVSNVPRPFPPFFQAIRLVDFRNPIDPARQQDLAQGSFLVDLGVCGSLLVAVHFDASGQAATWERQLFNWEGQALGAPVPLPQRPAGIAPLRTLQQLGQFLLLSDTQNPFVQVAQRMDKYGNLYGSPFEVPRGSAVVTSEGQLVIASLMVSEIGNYSVVVQRFTDPLGPGSLPG